MVDEQLRAYVRSAREQGFSDDAIRKRLEDSAIDKQDIQELLAPKIIPASVTTRAIAVAIDYTILAVLAITATSIAIAITPPRITGFQAPSWLLVVYGTLVVAHLIAETLLTASPWQATLGKRALHLKVYDQDRARLSLKASALRTLAKTLLLIISPYAYIQEKKEPVHDRVTKTSVFRETHINT